MESISIFDIFKIGVGPSSSHTLGPWNAALKFIDNIKDKEIDNIKVHLYGSLSKTGKGHATDKAIILGLMGHNPKTIMTNIIDSEIVKNQNSNQLIVNSQKIHFEPKEDIIFEQFAHNLHPNTLTFKASCKDVLLAEETFASVGGGFIERESKNNDITKKRALPFPIIKGRDLLKYTNDNTCSISHIVYKNELSQQSEEDVNLQIDELLDTIIDSVYDGCSNDGILPGGLNVTRRAKALCNKLTNQSNYSSRNDWLELIKDAPKDFQSVNNWVTCFALAVNEQNASMARVVTSPTNGAAGVIPAVLLYFMIFCKNDGKADLRKFLFTAGEIGCLFKKGATISAAVGGCQAEIGVSSAMAAGALTEVLGGTPEQCLMAAEIAMEHHLGLTCDPVKGLVQVPCIERNAMGAIKAITASHLALESDAKKAIVKIDEVIKTMWEVAKDMNTKYKETSEGGLALHIPVALPDC